MTCDCLVLLLHRPDSVAEVRIVARLGAGESAYR